jgi:signal transduction histidine kinase
MSILRESQQLMKFNKVLTRKSEELRQATLELKMANEKLRQIDELKDEFLNTVTHELRTPVTSIRAFAEILYDNPDLDEAERLEFLQTIIFESERMSRLITDVLDLEKLEAGTQKITVSLFTIGGLLDESVKSVKQLANEKKIRIFTYTQPDIPLVEADRDRILQVLLNLLSNAIKFCPETGGEINLTAVSEGNILRCRVTDNGVGVPADYQELIFDKFYQLKRKSSDHKPKGTGLGLAISKKIVELHQGQIWVENVDPNGASFAFAIPLVQAKNTKAAAEQHENL